VGLVQKHHRGGVRRLVFCQADGLFDSGRGFLYLPGPELGLGQFAQSDHIQRTGQIGAAQEALTDFAGLVVIASDPQRLGELQ
jgi:hypothetical protein